MVISGKREEIDAMSDAPPLEELTWTPQMVARYWDYENRFQENFFTYHVGRVLVKHFRRFLNKPKRLIDYGAGAGISDRRIASRKPAVCGH